MRFIGGDQGDQPTRQVRAVASGALPSGDPVVVNSDGTVGVVEGNDAGFGTETAYITADLGSNTNNATFDSNSNKVVVVFSDQDNSSYGTAVVGTVSGTSISFGSPTVFESAQSDYTRVTFDSSNNKVVVGYQDSGNSNYGTAIVGTVSGTSISFGSPVVFESAQSGHISATFDSSNNKIVIAYRDTGNSNQGTAIVGTVSGTSISFGTSAVFESGNTDETSITFDSSNNKVVVFYRDRDNSFYGTSAVGTVSGTSISFGSSVVFNTASTAQSLATFDSNSNKVVNAYRDQDGNSYGTAIVGTVSGTSISFGTEVVFNTASTSEIGTAFDSDVNKIFISYKDEGNSNYGTAVTGTVSGSSIAFESPIVFHEGTTDDSSAVFDTNSNKIVVTYKDDTGTKTGSARVFLNAFTTLTSENFIGFAQSGFPDTGNAVIDSKGAINNKQSGLTPGQAYFVQTDGTLSTTADDPSVFAGTAVAANKIIVEG